MQYQITSDNIEMSPSMETLTKEKFERLENRLANIEEGSKRARVVLNKSPNNTFTVKANVVIKGRDYFSDETDFSLEGALIKTVEEIVHMLEKDKTVYDRKIAKEEELLAEELE